MGHVFDFELNGLFGLYYERRLALHLEILAALDFCPIRDCMFGRVGDFDDFRDGLTEAAIELDRWTFWKVVR